MAIPISGQAKTLLIDAPHKLSVLEGRDVALPAEHGGLTRLPPGGCVQAGPELPLLGIASPHRHQKQPVSLPLARGEQSVGLSPADPLADPRQAAGLQSPFKGMPLPWGSTEQGREAGALPGWEMCLGLGEEPAFSRQRQSVQLKGTRSHCPNSYLTRLRGQGKAAQS